MAVSYFGKVRNLEYWMEEEFYEDSGRQGRACQYVVYMYNMYKEKG